MRVGKIELSRPDASQGAEVMDPSGEERDEIIRIAKEEL